MAKKGFFSIQNIIKHYFQSYFDQKPLQKKTTFFDRKHGLTCLGKCDFWDFKRLNFFIAQKGFFSIYNIIKHNFQSYFDQKQIKKKKYIFLPKAWVNPFGKMRFLGLSKTECFMAKKGFFCFQNIIKHYFQSYFDRKPLQKETTFIDQKHGSLERAFGKMRFLGL